MVSDVRSGHRKGTLCKCPPIDMYGADLWWPLHPQIVDGVCTLLANYTAQAGSTMLVVKASPSVVNL